MEQVGKCNFSCPFIFSLTNGLEGKFLVNVFFRYPVVNITNSTSSLFFVFYVSKYRNFCSPYSSDLQIRKQNCLIFLVPCAYYWKCSYFSNKLVKKKIHVLL